MKKYKFIDRRQEKILEGLTIDESAKQGFKNLMLWSEDEWNYYTIEVDKKEIKKLKN